jgi:hypothetical protein
MAKMWFGAFAHGMVWHGMYCNVDVVRVLAWTMDMR